MCIRDRVETYAIGAHFGVSPGFNGDLIKIAEEQLSDLPYLPGISNPSQVMKCIKKRSRSSMNST